jgi:hypothetical protein
MLSKLLTEMENEEFQALFDLLDQRVSSVVQLEGQIVNGELI